MPSPPATQTLPSSSATAAKSFSTSLAAGLDPARSVIFKQSNVPAHDQLNTLLGMISPLGWLERVPSFKDQQEQLRDKDLATLGFLGYPVLQSADILLYQPKFVPVGADQVAHIEITRELARRFNQLYPGAFVLSPDAAPWELEAIQTRARKLSGAKSQSSFTPHQLLEAAKQTKKLSPFHLQEVLPEPDVLLTPTPKLPGLDGRKMSKSYGNTITLAEPESDIRAKLKVMVTDPARIRRDDPGNPEICPVGDLHKVFSTPETIANVWHGCTTATIGCIECKSWLADAVVQAIAPIQTRRAALEQQPDYPRRRPPRRRHPRRHPRQPDPRRSPPRHGPKLMPNPTPDLPSQPEASQSEAAVQTPASPPETPTPPQTLPGTTPPIKNQSTPFQLESPPQPRKFPLKPPPAEASQSPFSITVGHVYDGPMDLLLDLIRKQNIDIYDIPIARITSQFLEYTHHLKQTDVDAAGEFIYMASLLIHIKSKLLLPRDPSDVNTPDSEDPRRELVERLLEHERFKAAAQMLLQKQQVEDATWSHPGMPGFLRDAAAASASAEAAPLLNATQEIAADTGDLVRVFSDILARLRARPVLNVNEDQVTVAQMMEFLKRRMLMEDKPISLRRLILATHTERAVICAFLAMLELVRLQAVLLFQPTAQADILLKKSAAFDQIFEDDSAARDDWR